MENFRNVADTSNVTAVARADGTAVFPSVHADRLDTFSPGFSFFHSAKDSEGHCSGDAVGTKTENPGFSSGAVLEEL